MDHYTQSRAAVGEDHESASRMMDEEPAAPPEQGGMVVDNVSIRRAKNGGWIVNCSKHEANPSSNRPGRYESNDYTFATLGEAVPFIEQEFGASGEGSSAMPSPTMPTGAMV